MDPFAIAGLLHGDLALTPGQLAQLRALNTKYFSELYALQHEGAEASAELDARIAADIRQMLSEEQRALLESSLSPTAEGEVELPFTAEPGAGDASRPIASEEQPSRGSTPSDPTRRQE